MLARSTAPRGQINLALVSGMLASSQAAEKVEGDHPSNATLGSAAFIRFNFSGSIGPRIYESFTRQVKL